MGGGVWTASAYKDYAVKRGMFISADGTLNIGSNQSHFINRSLNEDLNPHTLYMLLRRMLVELLFLLPLLLLFWSWLDFS